MSHEISFNFILMHKYTIQGRLRTFHNGTLNINNRTNREMPCSECMLSWKALIQLSISHSLTIEWKLSLHCYAWVSRLINMELSELLSMAEWADCFWECTTFPLCPFVQYAVFLIPATSEHHNKGLLKQPVWCWWYLLVLAWQTMKQDIARSGGNLLWSSSWHIKDNLYIYQMSGIRYCQQNYQLWSAVIILWSVQPKLAIDIQITSYSHRPLLTQYVSLPSPPIQRLCRFLSQRTNLENYSSCLNLKAFPRNYNAG